MRPASVHAEGELIAVTPGQWASSQAASSRAASKQTAANAASSLPGHVAPLEAERARPGFLERLRARLRERWPVIRRTLPRDLLILAAFFMLTRYVGVAWVMTDSVRYSAVIVLKGQPVRPGELAVFAYAGRSIEGYYPDGLLAQARRAVGLPVSLAGPRMGDGFVKYLVGIPGDRIEVQGQQVWLIKPSGARIDVGRWKTHSKRGIPLAPIASQVIPPGYFYVWAPSVDALDSRYAAMGLVPVRSLAGRGVPLW